MCRSQKGDAIFDTASELGNLMSWTRAEGSSLAV